ncbi:unnamed protein product, partial [Agarophyton chilense]
PPASSSAPTAVPAAPAAAAAAAVAQPALDLSPNVAIPHSLPHLPPSYPATLFGALSPEDEHVTVWEPLTGKTVAGNAAPYRRNLSSWLNAHPGWEEKADELKSSKRRSAARRARAAANCFSVLCCYPVASFLAEDAATRLAALSMSRTPNNSGNGEDRNAIMSWSADDFVRLQEALFTLGQHCHALSCARHAIDVNRWQKVLTSVGAPKLEPTVLYCAHHMLKLGMQQMQPHVSLMLRTPSAALCSSSSSSSCSFGGLLPAMNNNRNVVGSPSSFGSHDMAVASVAQQCELGAAFLERSFRAPREPRVTVWNPANGRTISGNAAPCRRNLQAWMQQHPGWVPKEEGQLSSSRRNRNRKQLVAPHTMASEDDKLSGSSAKKRRAHALAVGAVAVEAVEPESPHFNEALQGLLVLSQSARSMRNGMTSSVSSSSLEMDDDGDDDDVDVDVDVDDDKSNGKGKDEDAMMSDEEDGAVERMEL